MNQIHLALIAEKENSDCFGDFNKGNPLCLKHCILRLSCAIEKDQKLRMEIFEELVGSDHELSKLQ
jgi:hypothetical protein